MMGVCVLAVLQVDVLGNPIDKTNLPRQSPDASEILWLRSNVSCEFSIEGKPLITGSDVRVLVNRKHLEVTCQPQGYKAKVEYIQPPFSQTSPVGFVFFDEDKIRMSGGVSELVEANSLTTREFNELKRQMQRAALAEQTLSNLQHLLTIDKAGLQARGVQRDEPVSFTGFGTYHALLIGIDGYTEWSPLTYAEKDVQELGRILTSLYNFAPERVTYVLGSKATRTEILNAIRRVVVNLRSTDNLLIFYAGHGQLDEIKETGYWIPVDGKSRDPSYSSYIPFSEVVELIKARKVAAKNIAVVTDSCYGGAMTRSGPTSGMLSPEDQGYIKSLERIANKPSRQVFASGGYEQVPDRSDFASLLKSALQSNTLPSVDLEYVFLDIFKRIKHLGGQAPRMARLDSTPDQGGQFILVKTGAGVQGHKR